MKKPVFYILRKRGHTHNIPKTMPIAYNHPKGETTESALGEGLHKVSYVVNWSSLESDALTF